MRPIALALLFLPTGHSVILAQTDSTATQHTDTLPLGKVTYLHRVHLANDMDKNGVAVLLFNRSNSTYLHTVKPEESASSLSESDLLPYARGEKEGTPILKKHADRQILFTRPCIGGRGKCILSDTMGINWTLQPEHKRFGQYDCRRATGRFRGRDYEAWYTLDIPIQSGPFKLGGLPGLILESYTTDRQVEFLFSSMEMSNSITLPIRMPKGNETGMTFDQYRKAIIEQLKNAQKAAQARGNQMTFTPGTEIIELWEQQK